MNPLTTTGVVEGMIHAVELWNASAGINPVDNDAIIAEYTAITTQEP